MKKYESLKRLSDNYYCKKYPRSIQSSASGLSVNHCTTILSKESLQFLNKENEKLLDKIINKIKGKVSTTVQQQTSQASTARGNN